MTINNKAATSDHGIQACGHTPANRAKQAALPAPARTVLAATKHACSRAEQIIRKHTVHGRQAAVSNLLPHCGGKPLQGEALDDSWSLDIQNSRDLPGHSPVVQVK